MHLGRFHAVIYDLAHHFKQADLGNKIEQCAAALENYASTRDPVQLDAFRQSLKKFYAAAEISDKDLLQPYAAQTISDIEIAEALPPKIIDKVKNIVSENSFDHVTLAAELRKVGAAVSKKIGSISAIDKSFTELEVEFERVSRDKLESEIGILIPREATGETLKDLSTEFASLSKTFRAINELTNAPEYDPKVRTISSTWWQIFVDLGPEQVLVWVLAIERIVGLFKSNLEIKKLQAELAEKNVSKKITDLLEKEIDKKVSESINELAHDIARNHAKIQDDNRINELENQLRTGLRHVAKRINQGAQIEINVSVPDEPKDPPALPGEQPPDQALIDEVAAKRARISELRALRDKARLASTKTAEIELSGQLLLSHEEPKGEADEPPNT